MKTVTRMIYRKLLFCLCLVLIPAVMAVAGEKGQTKEKKKEPGAKELSGMSIVGNDEAPKSLYIVPWKSSEIGVESSLNMMLNDKDVPVDRDVFMRQLEFYQVRTAEAIK
jgi:hypothetical protein